MIRSKSRHNFISKMNHDNIPKQAKSVLLGLNVNYDEYDKEQQHKQQQSIQEENNSILSEETTHKQRLADDIEDDKRREANKAKEKLSELTTKIENKKNSKNNNNNNNTNNAPLGNNNNNKAAPLGVGNNNNDNNNNEKYQNLVEKKVRKITAINELKIKLSQRIANRTEPNNNNNLINDNISIISLYSSSSFHNDDGNYNSFGKEEFAHSYHEFAKIDDNDDDDDDAWDIMGKDAHHNNNIMNNYNDNNDNDDDDDIMGRTLKRTSGYNNDDDDDEEVVQYKSFMLNDKNLKDSLSSAISDINSKKTSNIINNNTSSFHNNNNNNSNSNNDYTITENDGRINKPNMSLTAGYSFYKSSHNIKERSGNDDHDNAKYLIVSELASPMNSPTVIKSNNLDIISPTKRQGPQLVTKLSFVQVLDTAITLASLGKGKKMIPPDPLPWQPIKKKELFPDYNADDYKKPIVDNNNNNNNNDERLMNKSFSVQEYKDNLRVKQKQQDEEDIQLPFLTLASLSHNGHDLDKLVPNKVMNQSFRRPSQLNNNNDNDNIKSPMSKTVTASHVGDFLTRTLSKAASMFTLPTLNLANDNDLHHKTLSKGEYASFTTKPSLSKSPIDRRIDTNVNNGGLKVKFSERHMKSIKDTEIGNTAPVIYAPHTSRSSLSEATMVSDYSMIDVKVGTNNPNLLKKSSLSSKAFHVNASENMLPVSASYHNQLDLSNDNDNDMKIRLITARNKLAIKMHNRYQLDKEVDHYKASSAEARLARKEVEEGEIQSLYFEEVDDWIIGDHNRQTQQRSKNM